MPAVWAIVSIYHFQLGAVLVAAAWCAPTDGLSDWIRHWRVSGTLLLVCYPACLMFVARFVSRASYRVEAEPTERTWPCWIERGWGTRARENEVSISEDVVSYEVRQ